MEPPEDVASVLIFLCLIFLYGWMGIPNFFVKVGNACHFIYNWTMAVVTIGADCLLHCILTFGILCSLCYIGMVIREYWRCVSAHKKRVNPKQVKKLPAVVTPEILQQFYEEAETEQSTKNAFAFNESKPTDDHDDCTKEFSGESTSESSSLPNQSPLLMKSVFPDVIPNELEIKEDGTGDDNYYAAGDTSRDVDTLDATKLSST